MNPTRRSRLRSTVACLAVVVVLAGCGPSGEPSIPSSLGPRPSSGATVEIEQPAQGETVTGTSVHVVLELTGGIIVPQTTTDLRPNEGHVHLYVNNSLVSMNYGLEQDIPVQAGTIALKAEFVAADHAPFSPRVWSSEIVFTVRP